MVQATGQEERQLDERAARRAAAGDEAAFAEIYRRHFKGVHDFAARIVHDRELATEVVQTSFVKAWESLRAGRKVTNVKPWLYAIARNAAIDELRRRARERPAGSGSEGEDEPSPFARPDPARLADPEKVVGDRELAELVWGAAAGLSPGDYALLDMHLRRDLDADEIAEALDLRKGAVYTRLSRMKDALEESVGVLLLIRRGRRDCPDLDALLAEMGDEGFSTGARRAVARHARRCERCEEHRRRFASAAEVLGALAPVPALPEMEDAVWAAVSSTVRAGDGGPEGVDLGAEASGWWQGAPTATRVKVLAGVSTATAVIAALLLFGRDTVADPEGVYSTSHRVGVPTARDVVEMAWSPPEDASGYSVRWSHSPDALPDRTVDLAGDADTATTTLGPGRWYFILRTRGGDGEWTATVRAGPYIIEEEMRREGQPRPRQRDRQDEPAGPGRQPNEDGSPGPPAGPRQPDTGQPTAPGPPPGEPQGPPAPETEMPAPNEPQPPAPDLQQGSTQQPQMQPPP